MNWWDELRRREREGTFNWRYTVGTGTGSTSASSDNWVYTTIRQVMLPVGTDVQVTHARSHYGPAEGNVGVIEEVYGGFPAKAVVFFLFPIALANGDEYRWNPDVPERKGVRYPIYFTDLEEYTP